MKPINIKVQVKTSPELNMMAIGLTRMKNAGSITTLSNEVHYPIGTIQSVICEAPGVDGKFAQVGFINLNFKHHHIDDEGLTVNAMFMPNAGFEKVVQIDKGCYVYSRGMFNYFDFEHEGVIVFRLKLKMRVKSEPMKDQGSNVSLF